MAQRLRVWRGRSRLLKIADTLVTIMLSPACAQMKTVSHSRTASANAIRSGPEGRKSTTRTNSLQYPQGFAGGSGASAPRNRRLPPDSRNAPLVTEVTRRCNMSRGAGRGRHSAAAKILTHASDVTA